MAARERNGRKRDDVRRGGLGRYDLGRFPRESAGSVMASLSYAARSHAILHCPAPFQTLNDDDAAAIGTAGDKR